MKPPPRWFVLSALAPPAGEEFLMVDALRRLGARAVEREGERVAAWLPPPRDVDAQLREAEAVLRTSTRMADPALAWRWQSHEEWVERWIRSVAPRRVTERLVVAPAGADVERGAGDVVIRLEPGMAFGTAEHATTRGCLQLLDGVLRPGDRVVDIGAGSGVLAIAAALLGAREVLALEADSVACESAQRNVAANGVADRVTVRERTVTPADVRRLPRSNVILANLEAGIIRGLLPALRPALAPGGSLIVSGVTAGERAALRQELRAAGFDAGTEVDVEGWASIRTAAAPAATT